MSLHRRAAKRDSNEGEIVRALECAGADVRRLSGADVPDLLVGYAQRTVLLGVKHPPGPRGGTSHQRESGDTCPEDWRGGPWVIVTTPVEALDVLRGMRASSCCHCVAEAVESEQRRARGAAREGG